MRAVLLIRIARVSCIFLFFFFFYSVVPTVLGNDFLHLSSLLNKYWPQEEAGGVNKTPAPCTHILTKYYIYYNTLNTLAIKFANFLYLPTHARTCQTLE